MTTFSPSPEDAQQSDTRNYLCAGVILVWAVFFLSGTFSIPLLPPDEPKYAFAAAKMLETGDYITPSFNCMPRFDKPPVIYWLIAASYRIFGVSDWAARIPGLLATLGVMLLIFREGEKKYDARTAFVSAVVFATLPHVWVMGRAAAPEMILIFFETAAIFSFFRGLAHENRTHIRLGYVFAALAFLTKGPIGLLIPCGIVFTYFAVKKGILPAIKGFLDPAGIVLFLLVGLPWYGIMIWTHGQKYIDEFFLMHNVYRFTGKARQHPFQFYYYLPILLGSLYLWLPFVRQIWLHLKKAVQERSEELFFIYWAFFVLAFFTISANKLHNYILIAYPPLVLLVGRAVRYDASFRGIAKVIMACMAALEAAALGYAAMYMKSLPLSVLLGGAGVVLISLFAIAKGLESEKAVALVAVKGLAMLVTANLFLGGYEVQMKPATAVVFLEVMFEKDPIYFYRDESEEIVFYANRCISTLHTPEEVEKVRRQHHEFILLVREKNLDDMKGIHAEMTVPFQDIRGRKRYLLEIKGSGPGIAQGLTPSDAAPYP